MPPESPEMLLQDTKNVRDSFVAQRNLRIVVGILLFLVIASGLLRVWNTWIRPPNRQGPQDSVQTTPSPIPKTNTFVDDLFGTVLYIRDSRVYALTLPALRAEQIVGVRGEEAVISFGSITPTWSPDGLLLAIADTSQAVTVTEYTTGRYVGTYPLKRAAAATTPIKLAFDPFSEVLAISDPEAVTFYAVNTQKELGTYTRCSGAGVWLRNFGYVTTCALADTQSVVLIQFEPSSSSMVPLKTLPKGTTIQLLDEYARGQALAIRKQQTKEDLITISVEGVIAPVPRDKQPKNVKLSDLSAPYQALQKRIEAETKLTGVHAVSVASSDDWLVFEREDGLYIAPMSLKEKPYYIGPGTSPLIRPY